MKSCLALLVALFGVGVCLPLMQLGYDAPRSVCGIEGVDARYLSDTKVELTGVPTKCFGYVGIELASGEQVQVQPTEEVTLDASCDISEVCFLEDGCVDMSPTTRRTDTKVAAARDERLAPRRSLARVVVEPECSVENVVACLVTPQRAKFSGLAHTCYGKGHIRCTDGSQKDIDSGWIIIINFLGERGIIKVCIGEQCIEPAPKDDSLQGVWESMFQTIMK